ncbi:MAG: hypothetical protein LBN97_04525, partial [Oscillospiraceae bacterium]|nr:hypothetical protein [Oscillospiraceae bacterium]
MFKKISLALLVLYLIGVYSVPIAAYSFFIAASNGAQIEDLETKAALALPFALMAVTCVIIFANVLIAVIGAVKREGASFRRVLLFKLLTLPFFAVNFAVWLLGSMVFHIALFIWPLIPVIIAYTYMVMLGTSVHNIAKLARLRKDKRITTKQCVKHTIFQLIFVLDVIDAIV